MGAEQGAEGAALRRAQHQRQGVQGVRQDRPQHLQAEHVLEAPLRPGAAADSASLGAEQRP